MANTTPWYPGSIRPVRSGVYERKYGELILFCFFDTDTKLWYWPSRTIGGAESNRIPCQGDEGLVSLEQNSLPWRGQTEQKHLKDHYYLEG